jgi:hypothetical protein
LVNAAAWPPAGAANRRTRVTIIPARGPTPRPELNPPLRTDRDASRGRFRPPGSRLLPHLAVERLPDQATAANELAAAVVQRATLTDRIGPVRGHGSGPLALVDERGRAPGFGLPLRLAR